jgi:endoglucanase
MNITGILSNYQHGINLGGWLSQFREYNHYHFSNALAEEDIKKLASYGMDHVRLPIDYIILESDETPFEYKEQGFKYIDNCVNWCKKYGLNVVLDIHHAPGYSFGTLDSNTLFTDRKMQLRFLKLWEAIAKHYINEKENIIFELLNEVVEPDSTRWNKLAKKLVTAIRTIDKDRYIIIGGNHYNSINELKNIDILDDEKIIYTFHFYEPFIFTHQKASWMDITKAMTEEQRYPAEVIDLIPLIKNGPKEITESPQAKQFLSMTTPYLDKELIRKLLKPALDFMNQTGKPLYCGEYGAIDHAPLKSRINWHKDFSALMNEYNIARACWTYKHMNFPIFDANGEPISEELINAITK